MLKAIRRLQCRILGHRSGPCVFDIDINVGIATHEHFCLRCEIPTLLQVGTVKVVGDPYLFGQGDPDPESQPKTTTYLN